MSKKLALSSALSVLLMAGFAVFNGQTVAIGPDGSTDALIPARAQLLQMPALPDLPILR